MKRTYVYNPQTGKHEERRAKRKEFEHPYHIICDIDPYLGIAGDRFDRPIKSRKDHREYLKRNDFQEVGSEKDYFYRHDGRTYDNRHRN